MSPLLRNDPSAEQRDAVLAGKHISYTLKRSSRRRSIGLRINDKGLTVSMPLRASERWLNSVLQDKASWVLKKLDSWQTRKAQVLNMSDGEFIPYLGEQLTLRVQRSVFAAPACQHGDTLWVSVQDEGDATMIERRVVECIGNRPGYYSRRAWRTMPRCWTLHRVQSNFLLRRPNGAAAMRVARCA